MHVPTLLALVPLLALPVLSVAAQPAQPASRARHAPAARELYDAALAAHDARAMPAPHAHARRSATDGHKGMKKVRRRRSGCAAPAASDASSTEAASSIGAASSTDTASAVSATTSITANVAVAKPSAASVTSSVAGGESSSSSSTKTKTLGSSSTAAASTSAAASSAAAASSTSSSAAAAATSASSNTTSSGLSDLMAELFPVGEGSSYWSTSTSATSPLSVTGALKPLTAGSLPSTGTAPDGSSALVATYPAGLYGLSGSGYSFYTEGAHDGVDVTTATEVVFSYSVFFPDGFDFVKGGKMPGLYGGTTLALAKSCSGGRQDTRDDCFSARMMWRTAGAGEFYNYYPESVSQGADYCSTPPYSTCNADYGDSIGRGTFTWATGAWTTVAQRLKLNDVGSANGEQELFVNGQSVLSLSGLQIRVEQDTKIYGIMAQTFYGGSDATWAPSADMTAYFKDWSLAVIA